MDDAFPDEHAAYDPGPADPGGPPSGGQAAVGAAPPHSIEAEQSVLGAILLSEKTHYGYIIEENLLPEDFYRDRHRVIFESMHALYEENEPIDVLTVTEHLRSRGKLDEVGGQAQVDSLPGAVPAIGNLRQYGTIVKEHSLLRRLLRTTYEIQAAVHGHDGDARSLVERAETQILDVADLDRSKEFVQVGKVLHREIDVWQRLATEGIQMTGTPSGYADLDEVTGGFQPGNLIILAARPSMGKCLTSRTSVYDPWTGARRSLGDIVDDLESGGEAWVAALGHDLKLRPARAVRAFRNGRRPVFRMTTRLGRTLEATANHPLLTVTGWRELRELGPGDRVAVPRRLPRTGVDSLMPDAEIVLLAALVADGNVGQGCARFTWGADSPVIDDVRAAATELGVEIRESAGHPGEGRLTNGRGRPNPAIELCRRHGLWGKRAADKSVPDAIFALPDAGLRRFLSILFGCDGHMYAGERFAQVGYTTISRRLADDVQHLLLRLGIVAAIRPLRREVYDGTDTTAWEVRITGQEGLKRFVDDIGACGKHEAGARVYANVLTRRPKTNVDTAPAAAWTLVDRARGDLSWRAVSERCGNPAGHNWHVGTRGLSRPRLAQLADALENAELRNLATSDVWWDEIASIEPIGEEETFDIEVPGPHNFVADDIVVHNSALVTNVAENVALHKRNPKAVALFSLEMSEGELAQRFIASQAGIRGDDLRKGRLKSERDWKKVLETSARFDAAHLFIDDSSDVGLLEIRAKARRLHQQSPLGLIIVDYLQLMRADDRIENRVQQVSAMSRGLKILARELEVPVIALSQLSRGVESRTDKRPMLSDLRECVTGDTLVVLADGRRVPIADLVGTRPDVVAIDENDRLTAARAQEVWAVGERQTLELRLASGRRLRATPDHRIRAGRGWTTVGSLVPGDRVGLARRLPEPLDADRWPDDHVVLLGQLVGDGSYLSGQPMRYTTASQENSDAVAHAARTGFGATVTRHEGRGTWHQLVISGNGNRWHPAGVNRWLRELGIFNQRSCEKRLPSAAFRLPDDQVALLLRHLWATDGSIHVAAAAHGRAAKARVAYSTTSPGLASDVAALLLRLGIVARTITSAQGEYRPITHVQVSGRDAQRAFLDRVGTFGPRRQFADALRAHLDATTATSNVDTLPSEETWTQVRASMEARGMTTRAMAAARGTSYGGTAHFAFAPSRAVAAEYASLLQDPLLAALANSDLVWDRVVAVSEAGTEAVYDLTVPGPHCWLADGIVSHNSGGIEQDADLVMFIYRDEYYYPETTDTPGEAELIISKHRNGGLGTVHLNFQNEYPRFLSQMRDPT